jgi:hypothetical protein
MKKILSTISGVAIAVLFLWANPAMAEGEHQVPTKCDSQSGWYTNGDEGDRLPEATTDGFKFENTDLMHHAITGLTTDDLDPGTFTASPAPDQDSFFSVEVYSGTGTYATLRWNTTTSKWNMVTGGSFYENTDPSALVEMVTPNKSKTVVSFGVGYTQNPPGTVATTVTKVSFNGKDYNLVCPEPSTPVSSSPTSGSPSPTKTSKPPTTVPTTTKSSSSAAALPVGNNSGSGLPVTGPSIGIIVAVSLLLVAGGGALLIATRRRRNQFEA